VVVVTGGAGGIGGAIAEELGRQGAQVLTMDPMVTLDGSAPAEAAGPTTAERIVAAGGRATASNVSVTDARAVEELFSGVVHEYGSLDAVINVAGISRRTDFASGSEGDWAAVLDVHLNGYLNVLRSALPIMVGAGSGTVLGVTSGSGWRPANTGAYGCAKRAVAALTWQIGSMMPDGVRVNALSPIAATRMVASALSAPAPPDGARSRTGGLSLGSMPPPDVLGPIGAYLAGDDFSWCTGEIVFSNGSEVAVIAPPRLIEVVRGRDVPSLAVALQSLVPLAFVTAEAGQATNGATNPRFGPIFGPQAGSPMPLSTEANCLLVTDDEGWASVLAGALEPRGLSCTRVPGGHAGEPDPPSPRAIAKSFRDAAEQLTAAARPLDAVVVALGRGESPGSGSPETDGWQHVLDEHAGIADLILADTTWVRAASDYSVSSDRPVRVVTVVDATSPAGRTRAQAAVQLARGSLQATSGRVAAFAVSVESSETSERRNLAELAAHLICTAGTEALAGAELAAGPGWLGLRSHPNPTGSVSFGGPQVPNWLDGVMRQMIQPSRDPTSPMINKQADDSTIRQP
jgi:NAD(P)-dependent dehydrogenase (short-subunit alcohol dehydrogenase family)